MKQYEYNLMAGIVKSMKEHPEHWLIDDYDWGVKKGTEKINVIKILKREVKKFFVFSDWVVDEKSVHISDVNGKLSDNSCRKFLWDAMQELILFKVQEVFKVPAHRRCLQNFFQYLSDTISDPTIHISFREKESSIHIYGGKNYSHEGININSDDFVNIKYGKNCCIEFNSDRYGYNLPAKHRKQFKKVIQQALEERFERETALVLDNLKIPARFELYRSEDRKSPVCIYSEDYSDTKTFHDVADNVREKFTLKAVGYKILLVTEEGLVISGRDLADL